ncbi:hypothetical protein HMPREF1982_01650 [Clostridiales bacterium oral taxon 876 str. F0540]|nr:hypothetical protein HMPREF1982_01650 [Clostridiales bacterium oral taxon 876 str. F0540]
MKNFLIGMPGGFDYKKFHRDYRAEFWGIEAIMFDSEEDIKVLIEEAQKKKFNFGVHFPLHKNIFIPCRDPLFLSLNSDLSEESYNVFERELAYCKSIGAQYILVHFPKPVLIDRSLNWNFWRFGNEAEWIDEKLYPYDKFKEKLEEMFGRLSGLSSKYNLQIVLEHDAINKYLYEGALLEELFKRYDNLKLCIDTGRLHLFELVDKNFDSKEFVKKMAPYTFIVHLWNTNVNDNSTGGHYPVLPSLKVSEGWGDIESYLNIIASINNDIKVLFEHRSDLITDEELETCYNWINSIINK